MPNSNQYILSLQGKGRFSQIWLAATLSESMFKKKCKAVTINEIDVAAACDDILSMIEHRTQRNRQIRLSLYLSSQLMYGVTKILFYQTKYLQDSATNEFIKLYDKEKLEKQQFSAQLPLPDVPEPHTLHLPVGRDKYLLVEEPYPVAINNLMQEELNFGILTTRELEDFVFGGPGEPFEIRGLNWDEQRDVQRISMADTILVDTIQGKESFAASTTIGQREHVLHVEGGEVIMPVPSTPKKRSLRSPTGTPSKRKKTHSASFARELIPQALIEPAPEPQPEPESIQEQRPEISAVAPPELPSEEQLLEVSEAARMRKRRTFIDECTKLDAELMRKQMENVTFRTRQPGSTAILLPIKLTANEYLRKPAMHMFGVKYGETLLTFFRQHLTFPLIIPDEYDVPDFDDQTTDEVARADETRKLPDQTGQISQLAEQETIDPSKVLEKTAPLLDIGLEPGDQTVEQQQPIESLEIPEFTVHEEKSEERVPDVSELIRTIESRRSSSPVNISKQDLLAQAEVLLSGEKWISFDRLVPRNSYNAKEAAVAFGYCLQFHTEKKIILKQAEPFAELWMEKFDGEEDQ